MYIPRLLGTFVTSSIPPTSNVAERGEKGFPRTTMRRPITQPGIGLRTSEPRAGSGMEVFVFDELLESSFRIA